MASISTHQDVLFNKVLPTMIETRLNEWIEKSSSISIFVTGKTGTGKSTLINAVVGSIVSPVGHSLDSMTGKVKMYQTKINNIQVNIWDSPGLQDGTTKESEYLDDIKENCNGKVDLIVYCIDMSKTRFLEGNRDVKAMQQLSKCLGVDMWKHTLIVLTFANSYILQVKYDYDDPKELQKEFVAEVESWKDIIHIALEKEVRLDPQLAKSVAVVPAGSLNKPELLPGNGLWLSKLWEEAVLVTRPLAQPAFVAINSKRLNDTYQHSYSPVICEQPLVLSYIGQKIGEQLGVGSMGYIMGMSKAQEVIYDLSLRNGYISISDAPVTVDIDSYKKQI